MVRKRVKLSKHGRDYYDDSCLDLLQCEQHLLPSKLKSGENYLFEARQDENSVIHLIQLFYDHILNKKEIIAMSQELNHIQLRLPILFIASNCLGVFL